MRANRPLAVWTAISLAVALGATGAVFAPTATSVSLQSSPNLSTLSQAVTLTATVTPSAATGQVTFYDGTTVLGIATLSSGQATLTTKLLPSGNRSLRAYYAGDTNFAASTSAKIAQTVVELPQSGFQAPLPTASTWGRIPTPQWWGTSTAMERWTSPSPPMPV